MAEFTWLAPLGLIIGMLGTMVGAGGGFILMPILLLVYPSDSPDQLAAISLAVVFFNTLSGSIAYARLGNRIHYRAGLIFAAASLPGAILGAYSTQFLTRGEFDPMLGTVLIAGSLFLIWKANGGGEHLEDRNTPISDLKYNNPLGVALSAVVGFFSSILGIGGGIIHVPALIYMLRFPPHAATATSHFVLAFMSFMATVVHVVDGSLTGGYDRALALAVGVVLGAQVGAKVSRRVHGKWIIRSLAIAIGFVGLRLILM